MIFRYQINENITVKDFLINNDIPSNVIISLKTKNGQILVNDQTVSSIYKMVPGDKLEIVFPSSTQGENIKSVKGPLNIIYEDSYLLILDKPNNLACIPTRKHYDHSLANYVMSYYKQKGIEANIHFVGRLDAPTSGIIILAKNSFMLTLMQRTNIEKHYILEVEGALEESEGIIELGIERDENSIIKRRTTKNFINSKTIYKVVGSKPGATFVNAQLCTGKTHQLRLHFLSLGHPIVGDALYEDAKNDSNSILHLHSYRVKFIHPITKEVKEFISYPTWFSLFSK